MLTKVEILGQRTYAPLLLPNADGTVSEDSIQILNIEGLGPVKAAINTSPYAVFDGDFYIGASVGKRNIVMTFGLHPNWASHTIEELRNLLYSYFMPKMFVRIKFTSTHLPTCQIDGYVESMDPNMFSKDPQIQVSVICPRPDFIAVSSTQVSGVTTNGDSDDDYTLATYQGSIPAGFICQVVKAAGNPSPTDGVEIKIKSEYPLQIFQASSYIDDTHHFEMSSVPGKKYVYSVHNTNGTFVDYLRTVSTNVIWPTLNPNENKIAVITPVVGQYWNLIYYARFGGL